MITEKRKRNNYTIRELCANVCKRDQTQLRKSSSSIIGERLYFERRVC